jgi:nicotinamide-nucleotide amidase
MAAMAGRTFACLQFMKENFLPDQGLLEKIHQSLKRRKETIAVAESVTAGLLQFTLAQIECASEFYQGGITTYNLGQKCRHLEVEPIAAENNNCVSEKVTAEMALGVCRLFSCQWGAGVTGYATPVAESNNKVFAFYAIAHHGKIVAKGKLLPGEDIPFNIQCNYVNRILKVLAGKLR